VAPVRLRRTTITQPGIFLRTLCDKLAVNASAASAPARPPAEGPAAFGARQSAADKDLEA
jgi:hypothetical protein